MKKLILNITCLFFISTVALVCVAQNKSSSKLKKFSPFVGKYDYTMNYEDWNAKGILEVRKACNDSCVELNFSNQSVDKVADVQWKILWNAQAQRYDVQYVRTPPTNERDETEYNFKFKGKDFVLSKAIFGNYGDSMMNYRWRIESENELHIIVEFQDVEDGKVKSGKRRGMVFVAKRTV